MSVLVLEDDLLLAELLVEHLKMRGFEVIHFSSGEQAYAYLYENRVDIALFDIGVPDLRGDELLVKLRQAKDKTPVIFITAKNSSKDLKAGFALGCDDYIKKPFEFDELDARMDHLLATEETIECDRAVIYPARLTVQKDMQTYHLTPKAMEVLCYLVRHKGRVVSKEELVQNLWEEIPTDATIRSYIKTLRKIFPNITTYRGNGYLFA